MPWCTFLDEVEIGVVGSCSVEVLGRGPHEFVSSNDWQMEKLSKNVGAAGAEYDTSFSAIMKKFKKDYTSKYIIARHRQNPVAFHWF